jgi:hypothetical protein
MQKIIKYAIVFVLSALAISLNNSLLAQSYIGYLKKETTLTDSNMVAIKVLRRGDAVFIHSKPANAEFYHINHINTNNEGLVPSKNVYFIEEVIEDSSSTFATVKSSDKKDPIIHVKNSTNAPLKIKIENKNHVIEPKKEAFIHIKKGIHYYTVTGADMHPHYNKESFEEFKMYEWDFYLE